MEITEDKLPEFIQLSDVEVMLTRVQKENPNEDLLSYCYNEWGVFFVKFKHHPDDTYNYTKEYRDILGLTRMGC